MEDVIGRVKIGMRCAPQLNLYLLMVIPLPSPDTTPPVTTIYFILHNMCYSVTAKRPIPLTVDSKFQIQNEWGREFWARVVSKNLGDVTRKSGSYKRLDMNPWERRAVTK